MLVHKAKLNFPVKRAKTVVGDLERKIVVLRPQYRDVHKANHFLKKGEGMYVVFS